MRWTVLILNLLAALALAFLACVASGIHATHAYSTYHGLVANNVIVEHPTDTAGQPFDVELHLRRIGAADMWFSILGFGGAGACVINGLVFWFSRRNETPLAEQDGAEVPPSATLMVDSERVRERGG
jgi:hypothetical protein